MEQYLSATSDLGELANHIFFNTNKETWDCGICRKSFKEKNDLFQHLRSGTHEAKRFSCSDCGKAFASIGALAQHVEQSGHSRGSKTLQEEVDQMGKTNMASQSFFGGRDDVEAPNGKFTSSFSSKRNEPGLFQKFNMVAESRKRATSFPDIRQDPRLNSLPLPTNIPAHPLQGMFCNPSKDNNFNSQINNYLPPQYLSMEPDCTLFFCGISLPRSLQAVCAWTVKDENTGSIIFEGAKAVDQIYPGSIRPDYEGLLIGLTEALNRGIRKIRVVSDCELVFMGLNSGSKLMCCQSIYRVVDDIASQVRQTCQKFHDIQFHLVSKESNHRVRKLASSVLE